VIELLNHRTAGDGPPLLLVHGGAEDVGMLTPQAEAFAERGFRVIWYDRRGTGGSTRENWPDGGVEQHADDAAALLRELGATPATVLGFSSGGVVALAVAARHPDAVSEAIAWEPASIGMLAEGPALHAGLLAPMQEHLAAHPDDWTGAYAVMLDVLSEGRADLASEAVRRQMVNAEAVLRDDGPIITAHVFAPGELPPERVTVAVGRGTSPLHAAVAERFAAELGRPTLVVEEAGDHEVYLSSPAVLADALAAAYGHVSSHG
jgi:pimeloyl-ACP methyl ester carboxylesterase